MVDTKNVGLINLDLKPLADVANNVINKFAQAASWYVIPRGQKKDWEIAVEEYIQSIKNDDSLEPIAKAAKISSARKEIREYINMQDILRHAQEFGEFNDKTDDEPLDEEWTMFFYDRAKNVSRDDAKILWGRILANECNSVGSIPKQLIHILSVMSVADADAFEKISGLIANRILSDGINLSFGRGTLIMGGQYRKLCDKINLKDSSITNLESLGLIKRSIIDYEYDFSGRNLKGIVMNFSYHGHTITISNLREKVPAGLITLTEVGTVLSNVIVKKEIDGFLDYVKDFYESKGFSVEIM